jgi:YbbR domain-containing protein
VKDESGRLGLRLLSLALAVALWLAVTLGRPGPTSQRVVEAPVTFNLPEHLILIDPRTTVSIRLQGSEKAVKTLNPAMVGILLDLSTARPGPTVATLTRENVFMPDGLNVVSISPSSIPIEIDSLDTRMLPVEAVLQGEPAAGAKLASWTARPPSVSATGPRSVLEKTTKLQTEPIFLDTHAISFEETVTIRTPDPLVVLQPSRTRVAVELQLDETMNSGTGGH